MAKKDLVIGVDASTTACKVVVWNLHGRMVAQGRQDIPLLRPHADWHEQRAGDWWQAFCNAVRIAVNTLQTQYLAAICICPQRETFVPVDESGSPLRNAILWMDGRARSWMPDLVSQIGESRFHAITGKPPSGNLTGLKIKWLREVEPEIFQRTRTFLDVAAYLHYQLTGKFVTAWGIADPTGMFDMNENSWSPDVLAYLGVDSGQMPVTFPGGSSGWAASHCRGRGWTG
jgi:xylulokinase